MGGGESKEATQREQLKEVAQQQAAETGEQDQAERAKEFGEEKKRTQEELNRRRVEDEERRKEEERQRLDALEKKRKAEAEANAQIQANITSLLANISGASAAVSQAGGEADKLLIVTEEIRELVTGKKETTGQTQANMDSLVSDRKELQALLGSILRQTESLKDANRISKNLVLQILGGDNEGGAVAWWELMATVGWTEHSIESKYESFLRLVKVVYDLGPNDVATLIAQRTASAEAVTQQAQILGGIGANHNLLPRLQFIQTQSRSLIDAILDSNDGVYPALSAMHHIIMDETTVDPSRRSILLAWADRVAEQNTSLSSQERFDATMSYLHVLQSLQIKGLVLYVSALRAVGEDALAVAFAEEQKQRLVQQKEYLIRTLIVTTAAAAAAAAAGPQMSRSGAHPSVANMSVAQAKMLRSANMGRSFGFGSSAAPGGRTSAAPFDTMANQPASLSVK